MTDMTAQLNIWLQRLRAIAMTGLAFEPSVYDRERYEEILKVATEMAATTSNGQADGQLSNALYERWRQEVGQREKGYVTPKVGVGAFVFNARDEMLLIQRATGLVGYWSYVTGWADVGYIAAQIAVKEVLEEAGLQVTPLRLVAVYDSARRTPPQIENHFWSLVFYCRLEGGILKGHPAETLDAGFFARDQLPQPLIRGGHLWVDHAFAAHQGELQEVYFEKP
jgi:ADP-ribose pyrophosphatase YjhB (NUDIX family)